MDVISFIPQFGSFIWTVLAFVAALSVIVAIHEYGHYIVGRWSGIHADVFSIGFGPVLWSRHDRRGTRWQIAALPFGGYVKFAGDANAASGKDADAMAAAAADPEALRRTMHGAPLWARTATVAAGPIFNFVLSVLVFGAIALNQGQTRDPLTVGELYELPVPARGLEPGDVLLEIAGAPVPDSEDPARGTFFDSIPDAAMTEYLVARDGIERRVEDVAFRPPFVREVLPKSAAMSAGLQEGDVITAVNGQPISFFEELRGFVEGSDGQTLALSVWRNGNMLSLELAPKRHDEPQPDGGFETFWRIGVAGGTSFDFASEPMGVGDALSFGADRTVSIITTSLSALSHIVTGAISSCNIQGPIGIAQVSGQVASKGFIDFLSFIAVLSTAIGFFNLFPVPALDGGHLVFYAYEAVTGRPPKDQVLQWMMMIGLGLILTLMVFALSNDLFCP